MRGALSEGTKRSQNRLGAVETAHAKKILANGALSQALARVPQALGRNRPEGPFLHLMQTYLHSFTRKQSGATHAYGIDCITPRQ